MGCSHAVGCPLFPLLKASLQGWRDYYCDSADQWHECARFKLSLTGERVPITLLPNGRHAQHLGRPTSTGRPVAAQPGQTPRQAPRQAPPPRPNPPAADHDPWFQGSPGGHPGPSGRGYPPPEFPVPGYPSAHDPVPSPGPGWHHHQPSPPSQVPQPPVGPDRRSQLELSGVAALFRECCSRAHSANPTANAGPDNDGDIARSILENLVAGVDGFAQGGVRDDVCLLVGVVSNERQRFKDQIR